jgi:hypothetical protein
MKKNVIILSGLLLALMLSATPAQALISAKALYGSFSGSSGTKIGPGVEMSIPILPLGVGAIMLNETVDISFTISGTSFSAGTYSGYLMPAYAYMEFGIPFVPLSFKARGGYSLFLPTSGPAGVSVTGFAIPGGVFYDVVAIYSMPLLPLIGAYAEVGLSNLILNVKDGLKTLGATDAQLSGSTFSNRNYSGMTWKAGLSIGI